MDHDKMDYNEAKELLFEGSLKGNLDFVKEGLKIVKDVNIKNEWGYQPLYLASARGKLEVVKYLINSGADLSVNNQDINGWTVLHYASMNGHLEVVKYLITLGVDVNSKDKNGWTPLHITSYCEKLEVVKYLISNGADLNLENKETIIIIKKLLQSTKKKIFNMFLRSRFLHQAKAGVEVIGNVIGELYDSKLEFSDVERMAIAEFGTQNRPKALLETELEQYQYLYYPLSKEYPHLFGYLQI